LPSLGEFGGFELWVYFPDLVFGVSGFLGFSQRKLRLSEGRCELRHFLAELMVPGPEDCSGMALLFGFGTGGQRYPSAKAVGSKLHNNFAANWSRLSSRVLSKLQLAMANAGLCGEQDFVLSGCRCVVVFFGFSFD